MSSAPTTSPASSSLDRRAFLAYFSSVGLGGTLLPGVLWAQAQQEQRVTKEMIAQAEQIAGLTFTDEQREEMVRGLNRTAAGYEQLREYPLPNSVAPALHFDPQPPGVPLPTGRSALRKSAAERVERPRDLEEVAFWPVTRLSELVRTRQVTATELTRLYLDRLKRHGPTLQCVVNLTEERALRQAAQADAEIAAGRYRGPLHGIPWGAKDLLATKGYPTTFGAAPYRDQVIDEDATVVRRLDEAGAILVAKLTLGALAQGDQWFGGQTKNPWNLEQGSSGSSAGSASATVAGLVGFSIGTETLGSIVSPSTRCGATGLRPTYGRVSRHGAMALAWSMDKLGPIARSVDDCAHVLAAIHGPDGLDPTVVDRPFAWDGAAPDPRRLKVGYVRAAFEEDPAEGEGDEDAIARAREWRAHDLAVLEVLRGLGIEPVPFDLPSSLPVNHLSYILSAEAATAFDVLTRSNRDDLLVRQIENAWPNVFRQARMIPAVEYLQANRVRTLLLRAMEESLGDLDAYVCPSFGGDNLLLTNLTGHPCVVLPNGFRADGTPTSITFCGRLHREPELLALARAYQQATDWHLHRPDLDAGREKKRAAEEAAKAEAEE